MFHYIFQARDRRFDFEVTYDSVTDCEDAQEQKPLWQRGECTEVETGSNAGRWKAEIAMVQHFGRVRDDLVAVSDNEAMIFSTGWGTRLEAVVRQVNHK